ncbi:TolC family protein [Clostridium beijerinckii]|jgi:hypothetical protein|uniref:TolC family protein n=3 Tax=Clostridium beijerinckii TaxID=1520 RepID=A0A1S8P5Q3_CLOBE|nr:TolC family protein [Clostridium beijerinckii]ABR35996.1 hypothetical protein Cbei_3882 [Clostridium beijerinckii NCIMB 8052]AIU01423.1 hypothetical protein Cbs_3882 [Clostridium beijerinckii ATCC 35702]MBF7809363.1 TolC family protein [Clostridium beijerinckii]NOW89896.1 hypothetical protein [Clostridium beijerinckii]NRT22958.1 hypothetical protein [Clostridium beijerinckii]
MKKNIKRMVAIGIGLSIVSGSINPVLAIENQKNNEVVSAQIINDESDSIINGQSFNGKPVLTLDQVINAAITNSEDLNLKSQQISMYRKKEDIQDKTNDFYESLGEKIYDFPYDKLELLEKQTNQSKDFLQDQISSDITNKYNAIIIKQIDISQAKTNLDIKNKDLETIKTKVQIGMATSNQLTDKQIEINSLKNDITAKENSLNDSMDYLGVLTNLNLSNYTLDPNIEYNLFKIDGSSDEYINDKIETYLKYNQKLINLTKDYLDDLKDDGVKDIMNKDIPSMPSGGIPSPASYMKKDDATGAVELDEGAYSIGLSSYALQLINYEKNALKYYLDLTKYGAYVDGKYGVEEAQVKLDDSKKSLKNGLRQAYSTLLDLENKINDLNDTIKSTNTKLKYAKTQVEVGLMTENNYNALVLKSEQLDSSLRTLINAYNNLKTTIQEPWVLGAN